MRFRLVAFVVLACSATNTDAAIPTIAYDEHLTDNEFTLLYDPVDGRMGVETDGRVITTLELTSASGIF